ncbi:Na(+)/H(+) antiporter subunit C [Brachybacterium halotolerans]|uniref:Na(+)/H(+) antiporter subunit C n=1 Tax=Brachybacterium halotolerans TaxID=2795215 RepID=UPI002B1E891E|nr:Na(+)/H(+) antiporter subunit C [Brachybacterium halotolerans]
MTVSLALVLTAGVLIACGVYLVLERTLTRIILGFVLLGNGVNLLFILAAGPWGSPPFEGTDDPERMTDPLPFAMVLTAIVITLGVTAFVMALAYRAWQLFGHDEVPDDVEDRRVLRRSRARTGQGIEVGWADALDEDARRGAIKASQGLRAPEEEENPLGEDLTGDQDVPQDYTEADEAEDQPEDGPEDQPAEQSGEHSGEPAEDQEDRA